MSLEIIDKALLQELKELLEDEFLQLLTTYVNDLNIKVPLLLSAIEEQNADDVRKLSHSLKGASLNLGAARFSELCKAIEQFSREDNLQSCHERSQQISEESELLKQELAVYLTAS